MDSPASDTPRQSLLAFLGRPSRPRTQAPPAHAHPQSQAQTSSHTQGQGQGSPNEQSQTSQQQSQPPPLATALSQLLPQSPIPSRRQTIPALAAISSSNNNTSAAPAAPASPSMQTNSFGNMLRRRRSANNVERNEANRRVHDQNNNQNNNSNGGSGGNTANNANTPGVGGSGTGPTHRIRLVPHLESVRSLTFDPISRDVRQGDQPLRIGRFTEHSSTPGQVSNKLAFKSKVVSRGHAEVWFDNGSFFIKDTKSSSGTFLNHIRLSPPNSESRPFPIKDGDVLQLGVDYQGGTEEMYRCVKIRIELGREWQTGVNAYNLQALQQLKNLANPGVTSISNGDGSSSSRLTAAPAQGRGTPRPANQSQSQTTTTLKPIRPGSKTVRPKAASKQAILASTTTPAPTNNAVSDCCICLSSVTICQALFIAPCSHAYHYKCIRPLLQMHHPGFSCPLCRTFADLEADVEGGETMFGNGAAVGFIGGFGVGDDQMVVDEEEGYEDENGAEEGFEAEGEGSGSGESRVGQSSQAGQATVLQPQQQQQRLSQTPEADGEGEGDAGAETDTMPEMMGPAGMGGFAGVGGGVVAPGQQSLGNGQGQGPGSAARAQGQGLIHDPTVDVDPSVPGLRLPLREDDELNLNSSPLFGSGPNLRFDVNEIGTSVGLGLGVGPPLIIEEGEGDVVGELGMVGRGGVVAASSISGGLGGSNVSGSGGGGGPVSVATLVNKRR